MTTKSNAAKPTTDAAHNMTYALLEFPGGVVLPMEQALEVFRLLGHGEPVVYDWQNKANRYDRDRKTTLRSFSLAEYASLQLEE